MARRIRLAPRDYLEVQFCVGYYRRLGKYLGIHDIPTDYWGFSELMDTAVAEDAGDGVCASTGFSGCRSWRE